MRLQPMLCAALVAASLACAPIAAGQVSIGLSPPQQSQDPANPPKRSGRRVPQRKPGDFGDAAGMATRAEVRRALLTCGRVDLLEVEAAATLERTVARAHTRDYERTRAPQPGALREPDLVCNVAVRADRSRSGTSASQLNTSALVWVQIAPATRPDAPLTAGQARDFGDTGFEPSMLRRLAAKAVESALKAIPLQARVIVTQPDGRFFLNRGTDAGVKNGQRFSITRDGTAVGAVRVLQAGPVTAEIVIDGKAGGLLDGDVATLQR